MSVSDDKKLVRYNRFLLLVAGLGGLLYGIDVGIIGGALPYLEATSHLSPAELSIIVAAVLLGSVFSTLFAGLLADWMGRKPLMIVSGVAFTLSIPVIALSQGYSALFFGRLLQGMSGGLVGVVVPLYLAECLSAQKRGRGTGVFQWLLTLGIFAAAIIGISSATTSMPSPTPDLPTLSSRPKTTPGAASSGCPCPPASSSSSAASSSPSRRAGSSAAASRIRPTPRSSARAPPSRPPSNCARWARSPPTPPPRATAGQAAANPLLQRRYVIPFLLACVILSCNTATGINSVIGYNTNILSPAASPTCRPTGDT